MTLRGRARRSGGPSCVVLPGVARGRHRFSRAAAGVRLTLSSFGTRHTPGRSGGYATWIRLHERRRSSACTSSSAPGTWRRSSLVSRNEVVRGGQAVFEWMKGQRLVVQRTQILAPEVSDSLAIVAFDSEANTYTQHYCDSRGMIRLYAMTFSDGHWTLLRTSAAGLLPAIHRHPLPRRQCDQRRMGNVRRSRHLDQGFRPDICAGHLAGA
jgi:hypothetical protein